ncbi:hypothetical protein [Nonomuraea dietziae]|uniref:hypothetical protein n=1 Tax=Nonomuraea dietziae TaxID=65515 RepID=UPI0031DF22B8
MLEAREAAGGEPLTTREIAERARGAAAHGPPHAAPAWSWPGSPSAPAPDQAGPVAAR